MSTAKTRTITEKATFAAGCFWGVEAAFAQVPGVVTAVCGYTGGTTENPTYHDVCTGSTGHAEAVQLTFDPSNVTYQVLLDVFWRIHDPTLVDRQGPDIGSQYRSVIFTHSHAQETLATASRDAQQKRLDRPIATQIEPAPPFYRAEEYHQRYFARHGVSCGVSD